MLVALDGWRPCVAAYAAISRSFSLDYANDGTGRDHDSLGLLQMRPNSGWGTVRQLFDPTYQAEAFFGGPTGPNTGSPAGLLDIPDWTELTDGQAAQAVEASAYPGRTPMVGQSRTKSSTP